MSRPHNVESMTGDPRLATRLPALREILEEQRDVATAAVTSILTSRIDPQDEMAVRARMPLSWRLPSSTRPWTGSATVGTGSADGAVVRSRSSASPPSPQPSCVSAASGEGKAVTADRDRSRPAASNALVIEG